MIYNVIFASAAVANLLTYLSFKLRQKFYYVVLIFLFCFAAFRWEVGCDWDGYQLHANFYALLPFEQLRSLGEPGYWLLIVILNRLGFDYPAINVVACLSFFIGLHALARRQPDPLIYLTLSFPILITGIAMSTVRQELAMGFICFAFLAFEDRKLVKYISYVLVASLFHKSAVAFLLLTPYLLPIGRNYRIIAILAALPILAVLARSDAATGYVNMYIGGKQEAAGGPIRTFMIMATGLAFYYIRDRWRRFSPGDYDLVNSLAPGLLAVFPISLVSSVIGDRFGYYLMLIAFIIQSKAYLIVERKAAMLAFIIPIVVGAVMLLIWTQYSTLFDQCYLPYRTWWTVN